MDCFHKLVTLPCSRDRLKISGVRFCAKFVWIIGEIRSGPDALLAFRECSVLRTSSSVTLIIEVGCAVRRSVGTGSGF